MKDAIGAMRARVTVQRPERVADEIGGAAILWTDEAELWAAIEAVSGDERVAHDGAASLTRFRVMINDYEGVRAGWRLLWGERVLRIAGVTDDCARRLQLSCEEELL